MVLAQLSERSNSPEISWLTRLFDESQSHPPTFGHRRRCALWLEAPGWPESQFQYLRKDLSRPDVHN
ncbi:hypothetical protein D8O01_19565, partial [Acinetobacter baumannii]